MSVEKSKNNRLSIGIVGAGPAGAMAAHLLAKAGHKVEILERKAYGERKVCGEYLCPKGVELLEDLKLADLLCQGFSPLHGMVLVSPENDIVPSYFPRPKMREKGLSLNRQVFDQRILNLALTSGAILHSDKTVTDVIFDKEQKKWTVYTHQDHFTFDLLIAADGRQSKVGHILGHIKNINTKRVALHCYLPRKTHHGLRLGEMHIFGDGSYCGLDPISDNEVNFSIVCDSSILKTKKPRVIVNDFIKRSGRLSKMFDPVDESQQVEIRIVSCLKNTNNFIAGDRLAYIGDAAGFIDPLTGEGIYNALLSGQLLAREIEEAGNLEMSLQKYKKSKKKLSLQKNILNHFFQFLIKSPLLISIVTRYLKKSPEKANEFIGIIGNINNPIKGFIKMLKA